MKKKKFGKGLAILLLIVLLIALGYLIITYLFGGSEEQKIEKKLLKMTKSFYEDYYYDSLVEQKGSKDKAIVFLSNYADSGLKIGFDSLKEYYDEVGNMNYTDLMNCSEKNTIVYIYPKSPYSKKDYTLKVKLSCDLNEATDDSKKFKKEYEVLNDKEGYTKVELEDNNLIKYSTLKEINKKIKNSESFVIFLGSPYFNESRYTISSFVDVSKDNNIKEIYYVDIKKDNKDENDIRTIYTLNENNEVVKSKEGSSDYIDFVASAKDILPISFEEYIKGTDYEGDRTILNVAYIYVENGVPIVYTDGLPNDTQDYNSVNQAQIKQIFKEFYNKRKAN